MAQTTAAADVGGTVARPYDHICALYRGRDERDRLMLPFLEDGLEAGDTCLALVSQPSIKDLADYEARATIWACAHPQSCICMYALDHFGGDLIFAVMQAHPKVRMSGVIVENPYHRRMDEEVAVS